MNVNASSFSFVPGMEPNFEVDSLKPTVSRSWNRARGAKSDKYQTKFKTELCKSFCENGYCRYKMQCKFAHGAGELTQEDRVSSRDKNCKSFFASGYCPYGIRCQFHHEHRNINQIKRYPYVVKLLTYESLYSTSMDQAIFVDSY